MSPRRPDPGNDHIVVVGPSKTGTTGYYALVKNAVATAGFHYSTVFEPGRPEVLDSLWSRDPHRPVLAKVTVDRVRRVVPDPTAFERRLTTVRDPRDTVISSLLFRPLTRSALERTDAESMTRFIDSVRRKERDPSSLSVAQLFRQQHRVGIGRPPYQAMLDDLELQLQLISEADFFPVRYDDLLTGEHSGLHDYLGFPVGQDTRTSSSTYGHIARSKQSGAFRHWFRADDLARYNELFGRYLDAFGFERDVELVDAPVLDPGIGSRYLLEQTGARRAKLSRWNAVRPDVVTNAPVESIEEREVLADHAEDGDSRACLRLAGAYERGDLDAPDVEQALRWARRSAQLGNDDGVRKTVALLTVRPNEDPADSRDLRVWQSVLAQRDRSRIVELESELARERASSRRRLGDLLVDLIRNPRQNLVASTRGLVRMWRSRRRD